jgi:hypothetical protein
MSVSKRRRPGEGAMGAVEHVWASKRINTAYGTVISLCTRTGLSAWARLHDGKLQSRSSGHFGVSVSQAVVVPPYSGSSSFIILSSLLPLFCSVLPTHGGQFAVRLLLVSAKSMLGVPIAITLAIAQFAPSQDLDQRRPGSGSHVVPLCAWLWC